MINYLRRKLYPTWKKKWARKLKHKRLKRLADRTGCGWLVESESNLKDLKILEVGVGNGKDFVQFMNGRNDVEITGVDLDDHEIEQENFTFVACDAAEMPFPDNHFDVAVSFGVLEHIQPVEKLAAVIQEIERVSKSYGIIVPSVGTILEPHTTKLFWHLRGNEKKQSYPCLNYYSDEAWLQFRGFIGAKSERYFYMWPLLNNLLIYKQGE